MESLVAPIFNFLVMVGLLAYNLRKPLKEFVAQRHHLIKEEIHNVHDQLKLAQEKYDEFSSKLKAVDAELNGIREQARTDALASKQKVVDDARRTSSLIVSDARNAANNLFEGLRNQLYIDFSTRVLDRAENLLRERLTGDDRARIRHEFSRLVEQMQ